MRPYVRRFAPIRRSGDRRGYVAAFLVALILPLIVGEILFVSSAQFVAQLGFGSSLGASAVARSPVFHHASISVAPTVPVPAVTLDPPAGDLGIVDQSIPATDLTIARAAPATESAATTPVPVTPILTVARVGNTQGDGAYLRHTPHLADHWIALADNTPLILQGTPLSSDGEDWVQVRDPKNDLGWVPARFVVR